MKVLGIDYGDARIGLAISDEIGIIATPIMTYKSQSMRKDIDFISRLAHEKGVGLIVLGLPLNMNGTSGDRVNKTQAFGRVLQKVSGIDIVYKDERLTTIYADRALTEGNVSNKKRKQVIDTMAAQIILQGYLDSKKIGG